MTTHVTRSKTLSTQVHPQDEEGGSPSSSHSESPLTPLSPTNSIPRGLPLPPSTMSGKGGNQDDVEQVSIIEELLPDDHQSHNTLLEPSGLQFAETDPADYQSAIAETHAIDTEGELDVDVCTQSSESDDNNIIIPLTYDDDEIDEPRKNRFKRVTKIFRPEAPTPDCMQRTTRYVRTGRFSPLPIDNIIIDDRRLSWPLTPITLAMHTAAQTAHTENSKMLPNKSQCKAERKQRAEEQHIIESTADRSDIAHRAQSPNTIGPLQGPSKPYTPRPSDKREKGKAIDPANFGNLQGIDPDGTNIAFQRAEYERIQADLRHTATNALDTPILGSAFKDKREGTSVKHRKEQQRTHKRYRSNSRERQRSRTPVRECSRSRSRHVKIESPSSLTCVQQMKHLDNTVHRAEKEKQKAIQEIQTRRDFFRPSRQVHAESYLGQVFAQAEHLGKRAKTPGVRIGGGSEGGTTPPDSSDDDSLSKSTQTSSSTKHTKSKSKKRSLTPHHKEKKREYKRQSRSRSASRVPGPSRYIDPEYVKPSDTNTDDSWDTKRYKRQARRLWKADQHQKRDMQKALKPVEPPKY